MMKLAVCVHSYVIPMTLHRMSDELIFVFGRLNYGSKHFHPSIFLSTCPL